jgi:succinoglycan biosynthesis protein ExoA
MARANQAAHSVPLGQSSAHSAAKRPSVLVVIPTLNEAAHIEQVVLSLLAGAAHTDTTVVVVDGGSMDGTPQRVLALAAREPAVHLLHNPKRVQSAAVNQAASQFGQGVDVLIRCDAHAAYPEAFVPRLLDTLTAQGADSVVVPLDSVGKTPIQRAIAWVSNSLLGTGGSAHRAGRISGFVDHGHHAAFRMDTFRRLGGYDQTFTQNEDAEFDCRQRAIGASVYLDANLRVVYYPRTSLMALGRQYYRYGRDRSRTVRRHPRSIRARQLVVPLHLVACLLALGLSRVQPWLLLLPLLYLLVLTAASLFFALRHRSWFGLLTGPAALVMHTAWGAGFVGGLLVLQEVPWHPRSTTPLWAAAPSSNGGST